MAQLHLLVIVLVLGIWQLYWLISTWRRDGIVAAFKLFAYGALTASAVGMLDLIARVAL